MSFQSYKIAWWNIQKGETSEKMGQPLLSEGLNYFIEKLDSDIVILGEYLNDKPLIDDSLLEKVKKNYSYTFIPYNKLKANFGFLVLSKLPYEIKKKDLLDWHPGHDLEFVEKWKKTPRVPEAFERDFLILEFKGLNEEKFSVIPVHQLQPWGRIVKSKSFPFGHIKAVWSIINCENNPLYWQTYSLIKRVQELGANNTIVLGDFNISPRFLGLRTPIYSMLKKNLNQVECGGSSFPADRSSFITDCFGLKLDHVFLKDMPKSAKAEILKLKGSDHYPLLLEINF